MEFHVAIEAQPNHFQRLPVIFVVGLDLDLSAALGASVGPYHFSLLNSIPNGAMGSIHFGMFSP
jgi:hypothetical protein